jgi:DNA modification methylase
MSVQILRGDCRGLLATLPDESVHCVVTSPPYWGLRDYGTDKWEGGDPQCEHKRTNTDRGLRADRDMAGRTTPQRNCSCGARRIASQIGLEPTFAEYIETMRSVFAQVRRVLRADGTLWLNLGDLFQAKQMVGMPWHMAFALQADGWYLRSDIIWSKPNPMPESVTDRPTKAHEYLFLMSKSERYFYDGDAIREPCEEPWRSTGRLENRGTKDVDAGVNNGFGLSGVKPRLYNPLGRNRRTVWEIPAASLNSAFVYGKYRIASQGCSVHDYQADLARALECDAQQDVFLFDRNLGKRNRPAELPEGAVAAIPISQSEFPSDEIFAICHNSGSHKNDSASGQDVIFGGKSGGHIGCNEFLDHFFAKYARTSENNSAQDACVDERRSGLLARMPYRIFGIATFENRSGKCSCYYAGKVAKKQDHFASFPPALVEPCILAGCPQGGTVLDPFGGAGTVGLVADRLQRNAILIELNETYADIAKRRITDDAPLLAMIPE